MAQKSWHHQNIKAQKCTVWKKDQVKNLKGQLLTWLRIFAKYPAVGYTKTEDDSFEREKHKEWPKSALTIDDDGTE